MSKRLSVAGAVLSFASVLTLAAAPAAAPAASPAGTPAPGKAALERLKALAGTWEGPIAGQEGARAKTVFQVTAGGTAVMETLFPGTPEEMVSLYFLDGDVLRMTHYCAAGNQPRMRLDAHASTPADLRFSFDGGTGFDPKKDMHIHSARFTLTPSGGLEEEWAYYQDGKESGRHRISLTRSAS